MKVLKMFLTAGLFTLTIAIAGLAFEPSTAWAQAAQKYNDEGRKRPFLTFLRLRKSWSRCSSWRRSKRAMWFMISVRATADRRDRRKEVRRQGHRF